MTKEMIRAIGEIQLSEVDGIATDENHPERDPQRFSPEEAGRKHSQHIQQHEETGIIPAK